MATRRFAVIGPAVIEIAFTGLPHIISSTKLIINLSSNGAI